MTNSPSTISPIDKALSRLKKSIDTKLDSKQQGLIIQWLNDWATMINQETFFDPRLNIKYKAGDIVSVNFGYNVGSEEGGRRPAVVVEDNPKSAKTITVIPLSSLKPPRTKTDVHPSNVFLGELTDFNIETRKKPGTETIAVVNQIRHISKIRITKPTKSNHSVLSVPSDMMQLIYEKIKELYTTQGLNRQTKGKSDTDETPKCLQP